MSCSDSRMQLLAAASRFCDAIAQKQDMPSIIAHLSSTHQITATEYGESCLAPFLGKPFIGTSGVQRYFELIGSLLSFESMRFSNFTVDVEMRRVALRGEGRFTWLVTGESWDEKFAYMLDFDDELKVTDYQVWADSGAAYLARVGKLNEVKAQHST
ncbi:hypothetical protein BDQ17DRAFT_77510 [Cyathus striatus]|nr:hypothetical protein BDQ17DRAFT_77510 [Cyathus striatus]